MTVTGVNNLTTTAPLSQAEFGSLLFYNILCLACTLVFNLWVIIVILTKVKIKHKLSSIPVLCASTLGLLHASGFNLMITTSLGAGGWVGDRVWCGVCEVLHKYIVYCVIYCSVIVSLEASYIIARPLRYDRQGCRALAGMVLGSCTAILLPLPITICHFFYLKPTQILEMFPEYFPRWGDKFYMYVSRLKLCYRFYYPGTFDYEFITLTVLALNMVAVGLLVASFGIIVTVILRSRRITGSMLAGVRRGSLNRRRHHQNHKIAQSAFLMTSLTMLPWLPNIVLSLVISHSSHAKHFLLDCLGEDGFYAVVDATSYLYYLVPWVFPLVSLFLNPDIAKAKTTLRKTFQRYTATIQLPPLRVKLPRLIT